MLDAAHEWRLQAVQRTDPHLVRLDYDRSAQEFRGNFTVTDDGAVTARIDYTRVGDTSGPNPGKWELTTFPASATRTLANLFDPGTVDALILQIGATEAEAQAAAAIVIPITRDAGFTNTLAAVATSALTADPAPMATAATVYAQVNFRFVRWNRSTSQDVGAARLSTPSVSGMVAFYNRRFLVCSTESNAPLYCFDHGGVRVPAADVSRTKLAEMGASPVLQGLAYRYGRLYVLDSAGKVGVYRLTDPGTASQTVTYLASESLSAATIDTAQAGPRYGIAVHDDDLYLGYNSGDVRCFTDGAHSAAKDIPKATFGSRAITGMTVVGDVLLVGLLSDEIRAFDLVARRVVAHDGIAPAVLRGINSSFAIGALAYRGRWGTLFVADADAIYGFFSANWWNALTSYAAGNYPTAYPAGDHELRTMDKTRLIREAREQHVRSVTGAGPTLTVEQVAPDGTVTTTTWHAGGLTKLFDGATAGLTVTSITSAARSAFQAIAPTFDLDDYADGLVTAEVEFTRGATSGPGLGAGAGASFRAVGVASVGALQRLSAYVAGGAALAGIEVAAVGVFAGTTERGALSLHLVRNANNEVGYVIDYAAGGGSGAGNITVSGRLTLFLTTPS